MQMLLIFISLRIVRKKKFDAVKIDADFPLGVWAMYCEYFSDKVIEFVKQPKEQCLYPIRQRAGLGSPMLLVSWRSEWPSNLTLDK